MAIGLEIIIDKNRFPPEIRIVKCLIALIILVSFIAKAHAENVNGGLGTLADGTADDTFALQSAINAATNEGSALIAAGTFRTSTLNIPGNNWPNDPVLALDAGLHVKGAGMSKTKLVFNGPIGLNMTEYGYHSVIIEDLAIIGSQKGIGVAIGRSFGGWDGFQIQFKNVAIINWENGLEATNLWMMSFDNCVISSNRTYGLKFYNTHNISIRDCILQGTWGGADVAGGTAIGFVGPPEMGAGDNATIINSMFTSWTNVIDNRELNLTCIGIHCEECGRYYLASSCCPKLTWMGGYILEQCQKPWSKQFPALMEVPQEMGHSILIMNPLFQSANSAESRPWFKLLKTAKPITLPKVMLGGQPVKAILSGNRTLILTN